MQNPDKKKVGDTYIEGLKQIAETRKISLEDALNIVLEDLDQPPTSELSPKDIAESTEHIDPAVTAYEILKAEQKKSKSSK